MAPPLDVALTSARVPLPYNAERFSRRSIRASGAEPPRTPTCKLRAIAVGGAKRNPQLPGVGADCGRCAFASISPA